MSNIKEILHKDDQIMKCLASHNVDRINRVICNTNQGALELEIRKGERDYHFVLGAVPLNKEESKELMDLLFPVPQMEAPKQVNKNPLTWNGVPIEPDSKEAKILYDLNPNTIKVIKEPKLKKKIGRPKGSKDGIKNIE